MWMVDILIEILTHLFQAGVDAAQKRADAAPPIAPPPSIAPAPQRPPQQSGASIPGLPPTRHPTYRSTSEDPDYERTPWRTAVTWLGLLLLVGMGIAFWVIVLHR